MDETTMAELLRGIAARGLGSGVAIVCLTAADRMESLETMLEEFTDALDESEKANQDAEETIKGLKSSLVAEAELASDMADHALHFARVADLMATKVNELTAMLDKLQGGG